MNSSLNIGCMMSLPRQTADLQVACQTRRTAVYHLADAILVSLLTPRSRRTDPVLPRASRSRIGPSATTPAGSGERLAERQRLAVPSEDPDYGDLGPAFRFWPGQGKDAILQPPKPEIPPSTEVLQRAAGRDVDWEAAD